MHSGRRFNRQSQGVLHMEGIEDMDDDPSQTEETSANESIPDSAKVVMACPKCNRGSEYKVGRIRHNPNVKCPTCWAAFVADVSTIGGGKCRPLQKHSLRLESTGTLKRRILRRG